MDFTNNPRNVTPGRSVPGGTPRPMPQRRVFTEFTTRPAPPRPAMLTPQPTVTPAATPQSPQARPTPVLSAPAVPARPVQPLHHSQPKPALASVPPQPLHRMPVPAPQHQASQPVGVPPAMPHTQAPQHSPQPRPQQPQMQPQSQHHTSHLQQPVPPQIPQPTPLHKDLKPAKPRNTTAHSGLVGFIFFAIFTALVLSPLLPGKTLDNFPGSSQSESTGDQSLSCLTDLNNISASTEYDTKVGFPIIYNYSTTTTQKATCDGKTQTAAGGHTAQFNPLGLAGDIAVALALSIGVAKTWRLIFRNKS